MKEEGELISSLSRILKKPYSDFSWWEGGEGASATTFCRWSERRAAAWGKEGFS